MLYALLDLKGYHVEISFGWVWLSTEVFFFRTEISILDDFSTVIFPIHEILKDFELLNEVDVEQEHFNKGVEK